MGLRTFNGLDELATVVGQDLGQSRWHEVTQEQVDQFAEATGDHQWIHVDPERAAPIRWCSRPMIWLSSTFRDHPCSAAAAYQSRSWGSSSLSSSTATWPHGSCPTGCWPIGSGHAAA